MKHYHASYNKYQNTKTIVDGITFHSRKEAKRYSELKLLERAKKIQNLTLQPRFTILEAFIVPQTKEKIRPTVYVADFMYYDMETMQPIVEDVKGHKTKYYQIKRKFFLFQNPHILFCEI